MQDFYTGDAMTRLDRRAPVEARNDSNRWPPLMEPPRNITSDHARAVFMCLYNHGVEGLADFELERLLPDISGSSVRTRSAELEYDGFVEDTGRVRTTPRGRTATVARISRRMLDYLLGRSEHQPRWNHGHSARASSLSW